MPLPEALARFNKVVTNRISSTFAGHAPGFAILHHVGRKSGADYATPLNAFRRGGEVVVALTYGGGTDWLANVRRAGRAVFEISGEWLEVGAPRDLSTEEGMSLMPGVVGLMLRLIDVDEFVSFPILEREPPTTSSS
jgi:deazaflavin-dependent oxidoreductase (nitroreductase family)